MAFASGVKEWDKYTTGGIFMQEGIGEETCAALYTEIPRPEKRRGISFVFVFHKSGCIKPDIRDS